MSLPLLPLSVNCAWQIETSGEQGKHADFSEPRCLCWCAADGAWLELIDGTTGYLATTAAAADTGAAAAVPRHAAAPQSSRFCSQAALHAFAALCGAAHSAGMAPATLPAATDTALAARCEARRGNVEPMAIDDSQARTRGGATAAVVSSPAAAAAAAAVAVAAAAAAAAGRSGVG